MKIEIAEDGEMFLVLSRGGYSTYLYIYREAAEVCWDSGRKAFKAPAPRKWSYADWFEHIVAVAARSLRSLGLLPFAAEQSVMSYRGRFVEFEKFVGPAKEFTRSPLGIIALFIVLVYGFASLVVGLGSGITEHVIPLIYFMVFFPVIVFLGFLWLVAKHHNKLYGPSDFKNEDNFFKAQMASVASLAAATARQHVHADGLSNAQLQDIVEVVSKVARKPKREEWKNQVLWVDDMPSNNTYERQAFEAQGIEFDLAFSTDEALDRLSKNKYAAIISNMGRKEGQQEGYVLLDKLRSSSNSTPFIIYASSNRPEHKKMAREKGAVGATNRAEELFQLVMGAVQNGS